MDDYEVHELRQQMIDWMAIHGVPVIVSTQASEDINAAAHLHGLHSLQSSPCPVISPSERKADFVIKSERHKAVSKPDYVSLFCISDYACACGKWKGTLASTVSIPSLLLELTLGMNQSRINSAFGIKTR